MRKVRFAEKISKQSVSDKLKGIISIWEHLWCKTDFNAGAGRRGKRIKHADTFAELKGRRTSGYKFGLLFSEKSKLFRKRSLLIEKQNRKIFNNGTKLNFHLNSAIRQVVWFAKRPNNPQISLLVNKHYNNKAFQYYQGHGALLEGR